MNIKLFLAACITSSVSFSNVSYSMNETYVDENKAKDYFNTINLLGNLYTKHIFWNSTQTDRLLLISHKLFTHQALLFNSIQNLKQLMNYSDETINKFINNVRNNPNINLYSSNMMRCDEQINTNYVINIQKKHDENKKFIEFDPDDLFEFYSKFDAENLIGYKVLQLGNNELKLKITNIVKNILEDIITVKLYKRCLELFLNEKFIHCLNTIDSHEFNNNKNQLYTFMNNIDKNKQELFNDITQYCETQQKLFQDFNTGKVFGHYDSNKNLSARKLFDSAINNILLKHTDEIMICNPEQNIADTTIFDNSYIKNIHDQNINNVKLVYNLKKYNLGFLYNKKSINNMKNIIENTKKYNELKDKIIEGIL